MDIQKKDKIRKIILYNSLIKNYPAKIKKYIFKNLLENKKYVPDITLIIRSDNYKDTVTLWFDLYSPEDILLFPEAVFLKKLLSYYLHLVDIFIVGINEKTVIDEFYLEFKNNKVDLIPKIISCIKKEFKIDCRIIIKKMKRIVHFLDEDNYYMIGFCCNNKKVKKVTFSFNLREDYFISKILRKDFFSLFEKVKAKPFRGEQSYIVECSNEVFEQIGWMVDKPIVRCADIFRIFLEDIKWKKSLIEILNSYCKCEYNFYLNIGWFSYVIKDERLIQINLNIKL